MDKEPGENRIDCGSASHARGVAVVVVHSVPAVCAELVGILLASEHVLSVQAFRDDLDAVPALVRSETALIFREVRSGVRINGSLRPMLEAVPRPRMVGVLDHFDTPVSAEWINAGFEAFAWVPFRPIEIETQILFALRRRSLGGTLTTEGRSLPGLDRNCPLKGKCPTLTPRRVEILRWVAAGKLNKEIADLLRLSQGVVANQIHRIFRQLQVRNRSEAVQLWSKCRDCQKRPRR